MDKHLHLCSIISKSPSPDLFGLNVDSGSASFTVQRVSWLVQLLGEGDEVIEEEKPLALSVRTETAQ